MSTPSSGPRPRPWVRGVLFAAALPATAAAVLGVELVAATTREYLTDVDYVVREVVEPTGGSDARPVRLAVLGDSTAAGVGADDEAGSLPVLVAERVADALGRPVDVRGHGVSGARTDDIAGQLDGVRPDADAIVVVIGSNDVIHATAPGDFADRTRRMLTATVDAASRGGTAAPVVLGGIPRFAGVGAFAEPLRSLADGYAGVLRERQRVEARAEDSVTFVDIAALASPRFLGRPEAMSSDEFHPSSVGYGFWADALAPAVAAALDPSGA